MTKSRVISTSDPTKILPASEGQSARLAGLAASGLAIALWVVYWILRTGFSSDHLLPSAILLGLSLLVLNLPGVLAARVRTPKNASALWLTTPAAVAFWTMLGLFILGMLLGDTARLMGVLLSAAGVVAFSTNALTALRRGERPGVASTGAWVVLCAGLAGAQWGLRYQSTVFAERLALGLDKHLYAPDTLYHAAVTSMIQTLGYPSTGLDGAPLLKYHVGSHYLFAALSNLSGLRPVDFYQVGYPCFVLPALLFSFVILISGILRVTRGRGLRAEEVLKSGWLWLAITLLFIGPSHALPFVTGQAAWLAASESYGTAILLSFIFGSLLLLVPRGLRDGGGGGAVLPAVLLPVVLACAGLAKVSVLALLYPATLYLALRTGYWRKHSVLVGLVLGALLGSGVAFATMSAGTGNSVAFWDFPSSVALHSTLPAVWAVLIFYAVHYGWTIAYVLLRVTERWRNRDARGKDSTLDIEFLLVVSLLGLIPGLVLRIGGMSAAYFSDVQRYLAGALLIARYVVPWRVMSTAKTRTRSGYVRAAAGLALAVLTIFVSYSIATGAARENLRVRSALLGRPTEDLTRLGKLKAFVLDAPHAGAALESNESWRVLRTLKSLGDAPRSTRRETAVYVERTGPYWSIGLPKQNAFIEPAFGRRVMISGLPDRDVVAAGFYGYESYRIDELSFGSRDPALQDVKERAQRAGFASMIVLEDASTSEVPLSPR